MHMPLRFRESPHVAEVVRFSKNSQICDLSRSSDNMTPVQKALQSVTVCVRQVKKILIE